jgi:glycerophosphoryl diester phosphodiesterase
MPRPEIIAHRGTPRDHPENSLPGFGRALALGVDGIELDVHLTGDRVPVVHHDPDLAPGPGPLAGRSIAGLTMDELRAHELAPGVPVPTLDEVRALAEGRATLYVEVKARDAGHVVADVLAGGGHRTPVHSFDHRLARGVRLRAPGIPVGILSVSYLVDTVAAMRAAEARDLWQHWTMIDAPLVDAVHAAGGRVIAWTVNDPTVARTLTALGVDGLCSDIPDVVAQAIDALQS